MLTQNNDINKIENEIIWGTLLEIGTTPIIYLVNDNEDWNWNGHTWQAFPFLLDKIPSNGNGEIQQITIKISNVTGVILAAIDSLQGELEIPVKLKVVRKGQDEPDIAFEMQLQNVSYDEQWVNLTLGAKISYVRSFPTQTYGRSCPWNFKDWRCKYSGSAFSTCGKTIDDCRNRNNESRFGGFV